MKKLMLSTAILVGLTVPVYAEFYNKSIGDWVIFGYDGRELNKACILEKSWEDGSRFHLIKDLTDGELFIWINNLSWDIKQKDSNIYDGATMIIESESGELFTFETKFALINNNTIAIPNLKPTEFVPPFITLTKLRIVIPGFIDEMEIPLDNAFLAVTVLGECIKIGIQQPQGEPI